jgi:hypothetical protein
MRWLLVSVGLVSCAPNLTNLGHEVGAGAVQAVTDDATKARLADMAQSATQAARDEALGPTTLAKLHVLTLQTGQDLRLQLAQTTSELDLTPLREQVRQAVRIEVDEALGPLTLQRVGALREELVGAPLRSDVAQLLDESSPRLTAIVRDAVTAAEVAAVAPIKADADREAAKWRPIAVTFAVGTGLLLVCLVVAVIVLRTHRRAIRALERRMGVT